MPLRSREFNGRCAYCSAPLIANAAGLVAWRVGNQFVCNEFCADGLPDAATVPQAASRPGGAKLPLSLR
jgi:hypothetical protein